jgi:hypothetical protein
MPFRPILAILALLAAAMPSLAARQDLGRGMEDKPFGPPTMENASERLNRAVGRFNEIQEKFGLRSLPEAMPSIEAVQVLIAQARQALAAGNPAVVVNLCDLIERRIVELNLIGNRKAMEHNKSGPGGSGGDTARIWEDLQIGAQFDIGRVAERLDYYSQRLQAGKNPQAADLIKKIADLVEAARKEMAAGRPANVRPILAQAESLLPELQRLIQENLSSEKQNLSGPGRDPFKDQQPGAQAALGQAWEIYRRVYNSAVRLGERPSGPEDAKSAALRARVSDLLEKAKEALATGQAEAAKEYCLKAEGQLAEWHRSLSAAGNRLSPATWERLKAKLERAGEIVSASGNDKAAKILEKGREHFERAQRSHADGQSARAEVEMDLALKLAAKAVDIARSGSR